MAYDNPVIPGFHPDPSVCRVGEDYYLATSSFEYFPGVPLFHSRDLVHWRQLGHVLDRATQLPLHGAKASGGIYAPTLRHARGRFWMVTTNVSAGGGRQLICHAEDPAGPWSEPVVAHLGEIDPSLTFADDGRVYLQASGGRRGIVQCEIDPETGTALSSEQVLWTGAGWRYLEGPHLFQRGGWWYLLCAEGGTEAAHCVTIARSRSPWGPFEGCPRNPILTHRGLDTPLQNTGHADLIQDHAGGWWMVFLAVRGIGYPPAHHLGRETCLAPVTWDADGWPVVNRGAAVEPRMDVPTLPVHPWPTPPARDRFAGPGLAPCWNWLRNPLPGSWSAGPDGLRLVATPWRLDDNEAQAWIGRRQQHLACRFSAQLSELSGGDGAEAGITVRACETHHDDLAVALRGGRRVLLLRRRIGLLSVVVAERDVGDGAVELGIDAEPELYRFGLRRPDGGLDELGRGETRYRSTEIAGGFTGVFLAMYAQGPGAQARFPHADYAGL
ncbi:MAG: glycoside hydrolase family 43 protein [Planctomycetes bacterium]|nr:glycoside hydrolase family 43 protein [Planctomycetota bacterium]